MLASHARDEQEVFYLHRGRVSFAWDGGELTLGEGDVLTVPIGLAHSYRNAGATSALAYVVRGGDQPAAATLVAAESAA